MKKLVLILSVFCIGLNYFTLANAKMYKVGQTFDNAGTQGISVFSDSLSGGTTDNEPTLAEMALAYDKFADSETVDVGLIISGKCNLILLANHSYLRKLV